MKNQPQSLQGNKYDSSTPFYHFPEALVLSHFGCQIIFWSLISDLYFRKNEREEVWMRAVSSDILKVLQCRESINQEIVCSIFILEENSILIFLVIFYDS